MTGISFDAGIVESHLVLATSAAEQTQRAHSAA